MISLKILFKQYKSNYHMFLQVIYRLELKHLAYADNGIGK